MALTRERVLSSIIFETQRITGDNNNLTVASFKIEWCDYAYSTFDKIPLPGFRNILDRPSESNLPLHKVEKVLEEFVPLFELFNEATMSLIAPLFFGSSTWTWILHFDSHFFLLSKQGSVDCCVMEKIYALSVRFFVETIIRTIHTHVNSDVTIADRNIDDCFDSGTFGAERNSSTSTRCLHWLRWIMLRFLMMMLCDLCFVIVFS